MVLSAALCPCSYGTVPGTAGGSPGPQAALLTRRRASLSMVALWSLRGTPVGSAHCALWWRLEGGRVISSGSTGWNCRGTQSWMGGKASIHPQHWFPGWSPVRFWYRGSSLDSCCALSLLPNLRQSLLGAPSAQPELAPEFLTIGLV